MYNYDTATPSIETPAAPASGEPSKVMLDEIHNHLVYVLKEKLDWMDATNPEKVYHDGVSLLERHADGVPLNA